MEKYTQAMRQAADKFRWSAKLAADAGIIPYKSEKGAWVTSPYDGNSWWTGGFWPGLMWQLHCATGDEQFQTEARRVEKLLTDEFRTFRCLNHDVGFMYLLSCGADAKLTGDEQAKTDTLHAASLLMGRFNPAGFIRAWNHPDQRGFAIIDCMMNLSLLWWATRETGDPRFAKVAQIHAQTTLREFLRPDGSVSATLSSLTRRRASASRNTADRDTASVRSGAAGRRGGCTALHWRILTAAIRNIWTRRRKSRRTLSGTSAPTD